ncbi:short-chain dehydrogenase/reductase [Lophiotrema nucula]|uniref:Short-chain dehydrogenase/reductase n=1 Tax=Lophiotrema nucula TaxID=690887 RepID=A0A6A5ZA54_9PLEO|nr:short-chain dehydrogenase/reductase [Lophiotrema nucula]
MASISLDPADLFSVKGLVAVVTGGGTGIGLMIAKALEANGATVYIIGRRLEPLKAAASAAQHGNIIPIQGDVTSKPSLQTIVNQIKEEKGYINVLIANSGITGPSLKDMPKNPDLTTYQEHLWTWEPPSFTQTFEVNTTAVFFTITAFLGLLGEGNKQGFKQTSQVVATSSIGGFNRLPLAGHAYGASKAAVTHMMKQFASTLVPYDIRANVLAPGFYPSEMTSGMMNQIGDKKWPKDFIPEQRAGDIEDMAGAILFLVGRAGAYVNGNVLVTDGGRLSIIPSTY